MPSKQAQMGTDKKTPLGQRLKELFNRRYLVQLIVTRLVLALYPSCAALFSFFHYSYTELTRSNSAYYEHTAQAFSDLFERSLNKLRRHAQQISVGSRTPASAAYALQRSALLGAPVNYYTIFRRVFAQYTPPASCDWGVYYPAYDILFSGGCKYTLDGFLTDQGFSEGNAAAPALRGFFTAASAVEPSLLPLYKGEGSGECLYVGIHSSMGNQRDAALFFYRLTASSLDVNSILPPSTGSAQLCLLQKDSLLYCAGNALLTNDQLLAQLRGNRRQMTLNGTAYQLFSVSHPGQGWESAAVLPFDQANSNALHFYQNMRLVLAGIIAALVIMLCVLVYINYQPLQRLLTAQGLSPRNEWASLASSFERLQSEMLEQNQLTLDFLLKNLLYGVPIPARDAARLGVHAHGGSFCVYLEAGALTTQERADLADALQTQMNITVYTTDILGLDYTVMICLAENGFDPAQLSAWMQAYFQGALPRCAPPVAGQTVAALNGIHDSYLSCFRPSDAPSAQGGQTPPDPDDRRYANRLSALQAQVEAYVQAHFRDCSLSQVLVADHFGMSIYSLSRLFKNHIGSGFSEYVTALRLDAARPLLLETDLTIAQISAQVGIPNSNYFARLFKLRYQLSPAQFRKQSPQQNKAAFF